MRRAFSLRSLFLAAAMAMVMLPLVALGGGLAILAAANWSVIESGGDEIHAAEKAVTALVAGEWDRLAAGDSRALDGSKERLRTAMEVRDLDGRVLYASTGVADGEYHTGGGFSAQANQRTVLVRRDGRTVGVLLLWIWPLDSLGGITRALSGGFLAAVLTLCALLAWVLWWIRGAVLRPLQAFERATAAVAEGRLDFSPPASRVRELAALGQAFAAMRDRLQAALEKQRALEADRRRFIAAVGHDLRTPLSSVQAFAEGLHDGLARNPEKAARYAQVILDKTREMGRLVEDLFAFARLDLPETTLQPETVDAARYLQAVAAGFDPAAAEKGVRLVAEGPAVAVRVDPDLFARALGNLLTNAIRHTPAGGTVTVTWIPMDAGLSLSVADTGEGIPPGEMDHLFSPMHRTDRSRTRRSGGAGLGLAITARVVRLHGGEIACESTPGKGTCFTIRLPAP